MKLKTKYIIGRVCGLETAIVFTELLKHSDVARGAFGGTPCVSAGFCYINDAGRAVAYGKSDSLGLNSREGVDNLIIEETLGISITTDV